MGAIISRWRKKPSTIEALEKLENDIEVIEKQRRCNLEKERRMIGSLVLYSVLLYTVVTLVFYFYYLPDDWADRMKYSVPLLSFPILIYGVKRFLQWYFVKRITKNEVKLEELREQKKDILDEVMEKETYKRAKEILERFDATMGKKLEGPETATPARPRAPDGQELRQRPNATPMQGGAPVAQTPGPLPPATPAQVMGPTPGPGGPPGRAGPPHTGQQAPQWASPDDNPPETPSHKRYRRTSNPVGTPMRPPGPPMARPLLPRERSASDRVLEYLIGDGPQNRYALICKQCFSHNGMAYREEFDYLNFRCCYCYTFNKAKKQRPNAPKLDTPPVVHRQLNINQEPESSTDVEPESDEAGSGAESGREGAGQANSKKDK